MKRKIIVNCFICDRPYVKFARPREADKLKYKGRLGPGKVPRAEKVTTCGLPSCRRQWKIIVEYFILKKKQKEIEIEEDDRYNEKE